MQKGKGRSVYERSDTASGQKTEKGSVVAAFIIHLWVYNSQCAGKNKKKEKKQLFSAEAKTVVKRSGNGHSVILLVKTVTTSSATVAKPPCSSFSRSSAALWE